MADRVGQQLGNYQLIRLLGSGGFADVYLGEHIHLGTQAAIKVLTTRLTNEDIDGFRTEARTIARLKHPHIIRVLEFGVENGTPFLVMDYAPNGTLRSLHPKVSQLPLTTIVAYVRQVADALHYAHEQKLVHRDVKPENMLIGERNEVLLSDFGIATVAQSSRYQGTQEVAGTVAYMAPEQVQGHPRPASDQYSLGVVVYEWLSGERPFHGSFTEIATQHVLALPPPLREKVSGIAPLVEQVVMTALAKDAKERFASVQAFATALEQAVLLAQPTLAARPSTPIGQPTILVPPAHAPGSSPFAPTVRASQPPVHIPGTTLAVYDGHSACVTSVSWSPDGQYVTSASDDHTVDVWEATTGRHILTYDGHGDEVLFVAWSPDGVAIASGGRDETVQVWEAATGKKLLSYKRHTHQVYTLAWAPNGKRIASGGFDQTAQVWDAVSGELLVTYRGHSECVNGLAWAPNGKRIATASDDATVQVWDVARGQELVTYRGHAEAVWPAVWSPDGRYIASGAEDSTAQVWEAATGKRVLTYTGHTGEVLTLAWSPSGKYIASGGADETVQIWDAATGNLLFTYREHAFNVWSVAWSPDGRLIASAAGDNTVRVWQAV
jgi:WD40 repeat protein